MGDRRPAFCRCVAPRLEQRANLLQHGFTHFPLVVHDFDFQQVVAFQTALDLVQHGGGQACVADDDNGFQRMGACLEFEALGNGEI